MNFRNYLMAGLAASTIAITGCNDTEEENNPTFSWDITEANAEKIAAEVISMKDFMSDFNNTNTAADPEAGLKAKFGNLKFFDGTPQACQVNGTIAITLTESTIGIAMNNCDQGDGEGPVDGSMSISSTATGSTEMTISFTVDMTAKGSTMAGSLVLVGDDATGAYSFDMDMNLSSPEGSISIATDPAFAGVDFEPPYEGQTVITNLDTNAKLRVTAGLPSASQVTIEVDEDGNDVYETSITTLWTNID